MTHLQDKYKWILNHVTRSFPLFVYGYTTFGITVYSAPYLAFDIQLIGQRGQYMLIESVRSKTVLQVLRKKMILHFQATCHIKFYIIHNTGQNVARHTLQSIVRKNMFTFSNCCHWKVCKQLYPDVALLIHVNTTIHKMLNSYLTENKISVLLRISNRLAESGHPSVNKIAK